MTEPSSTRRAVVQLGVAAGALIIHATSSVAAAAPRPPPVAPATFVLLAMMLAFAVIVHDTAGLQVTAVAIGFTQEGDT
jgi:hypothetical protein